MKRLPRNVATLLGAGFPFFIAAASAVAEQRVASLPLQRGFYVATDTPCIRASNATLTLITRTSRNSARTESKFKQIVRSGPTTYRVTEETVELGGGAGPSGVITYEIPNPTSFRLVDQGKTHYAARYCVQSSLPQPWRNNDIRDLIK